METEGTLIHGQVMHARKQRFFVLHEKKNVHGSALHGAKSPRVITLPLTWKHGDPAEFGRSLFRL